MTKACNCYLMDYHYEAEFIFIDYMNSKEKIKKDDILLIMAHSYLKRNAYEEAFMIFNRLAKMNNKSVLVW